MTHRTFLLIGIAALFAVPAAASVADFRLPPEPTPTPSPRAQGPVLPTLPPPRTVPTPSPGRTATAPTPTPSPRLTIPAIPSPTPTPAPAPTRRRGLAPAPAASPTAAAPVSTPQPAPGEATPTPAPLPQTFPGARSPSQVTTAEEDAGGSAWPWLVALLLFAGAGIGAFIWVRHRIGPTGPVTVAEIERPRVPQDPMAETEPEAELPDADPAAAHREPGTAAVASAAAPTPAPPPLHISIEPAKLALTLMNATLSYRLTLTNRGAETLQDIVVAADLVSAHAALPREEQLAGPGTELVERHRLAGLAPDESGEVAGELRLPLAMVRPIIQGDAALLVPLARFRISAEGEEPRYFTVAVGPPSPRGAIQPVRLDLGPRIYDGLAGRAF